MSTDTERRLETVHWAGTRQGRCERKDRGTDSMIHEMGDGIEALFPSVAYLRENVTCMT